MKNVQDKNLQKVERQEMEPARSERTFVPVTDIFEKDEVILVRCDMPGVAQEQVDIRLENDELEISARQAVDAPEGYDLLVGEYETGLFRRKFSIPQLIDREKIHARLSNGVLEIELPKAEKAKPRRIEISTGH